jgi:hypothetical protein
VKVADVGFNAVNLAEVGFNEVNESARGKLAGRHMAGRLLGGVGCRPNGAVEHAVGGCAA